MKDSVLSFPSGQSDMKPLYHSENRETPSMMYSGVKYLSSHVFQIFPLLGFQHFQNFPNSNPTQNVYILGSRGVYKT